MSYLNLNLQNKNVYFIEIPQLGGDFGFLSVLGDKEQYVSIASKTAVVNADTEDIIGKIKNATYSLGTESDGSGSVAKAVKYYNSFVRRWIDNILYEEKQKTCIKGFWYTLKGESEI